MGYCHASYVSFYFDWPAGVVRSLVSKWDLTCVISLRWLEWGNPTILNLGQDVNTSNPELAIISEDYQDKVC